MSKAGAALTRRSRTPSAEVERELLAAAEAVLVRDGPGGLTVRAVAAEAGIAPMGLYSRLGGKDGLVDALLISGFDRLRAAIEAGDEPDTAARLYNCGLRYRNFALGNRHLHAIMFQDAIPRGRESAKVGEHAIASELSGLVPTPDPEAAYRAVIQAIISGLAPQPVALPRQNWCLGYSTEFSTLAGTSGRSRAMKWLAFGTWVNSAWGSCRRLACRSEERDQSFSP